jgi:hypothetical protein
MTAPNFFTPGGSTLTLVAKVAAVAEPNTMFPPDSRAPEMKSSFPPTTRSLRKPVVSLGKEAPTE